MNGGTVAIQTHLVCVRAVNRLVSVGIHTMNVHRKSESDVDVFTIYTCTIQSHPVDRHRAVAVCVCRV